MSNQSSVINHIKAIKYYKLTQYVANLFSKDPSVKVGALFMYPKTFQILSMGYNGLFDNRTKEELAPVLKPEELWKFYLE